MGQWQTVYKFWPTRLIDRSWSGFCQELECINYADDSIPYRTPHSFGYMCYRRIPGADSYGWHRYTPRKSVRLYDGRWSSAGVTVERCRPITIAALPFSGQSISDWVYRPLISPGREVPGVDYRWYRACPERYAHPLIDGTWSSAYDILETTSVQVIGATSLNGFYYRKAQKEVAVPKITEDKRFCVINVNMEAVTDPFPTYAEAIAKAESLAKPDAPRWVIELVAKAKVTMPVVVTDLRTDGASSVAKHS